MTVGSEMTETRKESAMKSEHEMTTRRKTPIMATIIVGTMIAITIIAVGTLWIIMPNRVDPAPATAPIKAQIANKAADPSADLPIPQIFSVEHDVAETGYNSQIVVDRRSGCRYILNMINLQMIPLGDADGHQDCHGKVTKVAVDDADDTPKAIGIGGASASETLVASPAPGHAK